ncbi:hypothetical protein M4914_05795 [Streptomyces somaliensis DSM 40738]|uniref:Uncharacterized protein n=1 Tax=Streptomyces somaliensis (strain ATCC 33201 / DSM 40738 / JCM 12659 / KCTC 9044 / NCTC 11332 / NRRL B-12077 / IP 733) TaxID=1134445 RepID=A0AA44IEZ5_STRE0|nr:hypothetical protein [Streptomyces somaliensis]MCQ0022515.1 hypothetical protein [Streptomyces somaliensis DSM 40738]NKY16270.1 hypothetical protein [Streptomyces somaliensis DSM 40738]
MITTDPVGEWFWETTVDVSDGRGMRHAIELFDELQSLAARLGIVDGWGRSGMRVVTVDAPRREYYKWEGVGPVGSAVEIDDVQFVDRTTLQVWSELPGNLLRSGVAHRAEKLFALRLVVWDQGGAMVTLATYSDAWLTLDLRERPQPDVAASNAPRLAAFLNAVSKLLGAETEPGDPTFYGRPARWGFEDLSVEGADYADAWSTFAIPARWQHLKKLLPDGYEEQAYDGWTDGPVRYFSVHKEGHTVGYLWAAVEDDAAGYEPRTAAGDAAFSAGVPLLLSLAEAHQAGTPSLDALKKAARSHSGAVIRIMESLDALQEMSGS